MAGEKDKTGPKGQEPEALATFGAAARSGSEKPEEQGLTARPETAPKPASLDEKQAKAAEVLREGAGRKPR